ncbi:type VI secretion system amidase effector protein Tae4 [Serratia marcescens]|uniref:type VI secretion system amidase effector protein Tae4 n=1 Tax=Serratia marcescens TaxID=615 RepID=UPI001F153923|nr:type VI secretion system amidase effector protein Tae4 [Serratia marcescens]MDP8610843.1 type VI secretion system amidase effector protein Tae4 [Serratia marcescens]MDP8615977.1 type VI secretion system amidase effector protein Tae4 [Serratia marcescens]MDP8655996.1 type VI secretion system amidase effector protein Tae4 [Serratia marcescens]MDP8660980.1 type VI secretion system amidase effector protein Tae4 [Serratia marcescens]MDP8678101.1 type VI secretion system amidase effector protein 
MKKPLFGPAWIRFSEVNVNVKKVGALIGGKVESNIENGIFENACPIRMSYVLNYTGIPIPSNSGYATVSGKDKKWYLYRVNDMILFLEKNFGKPDITVKSPTPAKFSGKKGIMVIQGNGWRNASGHVTLWNGDICSDSCHFMGDPENGSFVPEVASLWILK